PSAVPLPRGRDTAVRRGGWGLPCCLMGSSAGAAASSRPAGIGVTVAGYLLRQTDPPGSRGTLLRSRPGHRERSPAPGSHRTWRAAFPHHALRQVVHSTFAAIRSRSVSMVSLILSLHRGL